MDGMWDGCFDRFGRKWLPSSNGQDRTLPHHLILGFSISSGTWREVWKRRLETTIRKQNWKSCQKGTISDAAAIWNRDYTAAARIGTGIWRHTEERCPLTACVARNARLGGPKKPRGYLILSWKVMVTVVPVRKRIVLNIKEPNKI